MSPWRAFVHASCHSRLCKGSTHPLDCWVLPALWFPNGKRTPMNSPSCRNHPSPSNSRTCIVLGWFRALQCGSATHWSINALESRGGCLDLSNPGGSLEAASQTRATQNQKSNWQYINIIIYIYIYVEVQQLHVDKEPACETALFEDFAKSNWALAQSAGERTAGGRAVRVLNLLQTVSNWTPKMLFSCYSQNWEFWESLSKKQLRWIRCSPWMKWVAKNIKELFFRSPLQVPSGKVLSAESGSTWSGKVVEWKGTGRISAMVSGHSCTDGWQHDTPKQVLNNRNPTHRKRLVIPAGISCR